MTATNDQSFKGTPEDEALAGHIYDQFPAFEAGNQRNRAACVKLIAEAMRPQRQLMLNCWHSLNYAVGFIRGLGHRSNYVETKLDEIREAIREIIPDEEFEAEKP